MRIFLLSIVLVITSCSKNVDLILHNGVVYSGGQQLNKSSAFAIKDGVFIAVSEDDNDILKNYSSDNVINAQGLPVYPGFIDSHAHFYNLGYSINQVDLFDTKSIEEVVARVIDYDNKRNSNFIIGRGWDQNDWSNKSFPTNKLLNESFPNKPVVLRRIDGHAYLVNDAALKLANITTSSKSEGGEFVKIRGKLTGVLIDNAMRLIDQIIPNPTIEESVKALIAAQEACFKNGLTTVSDAGISKDQIMLIDSLQREGVLDIKIYAMIENDKESVDFFIQNGPLKTPKLNVRSVKVYADGALGSRGASLIKPYSDRLNHYGLMRTPIDSIRLLAFKLAGSKLQMNTHAIGDNANRVVLNAYRDALYDYRDPRWRIEHAQVIHKDDYELFNPKIIPSVQPTHATSDMYWLNDRIGKSRAKHSYAWADLYEKSGVIALGTDFPVEDISPIMTFHAATVRQDSKGYPEDGFQMENALGRGDALLGMTYFGAYANFEEDEKGSIELGKAADFVILDNDILRVSPPRIRGTQVVATFIDGKLVYSRRDN